MNFFPIRAVKQQLSLLENRVGVKPATIGRMVFVHDADLDITEAQFKDMIDFFSPEYKTIERVYFHLNKKMLEGLPKPHLHPKSLDWRGRIAEDDLKFVLLQPYDIAIHFVQHSTLSLASFSAASLFAAASASDFVNPSFLAWILASFSFNHSASF